jgi:hypothetical protein
MFNCNVLRCGVCLGCNFLVDSCSNAFVSFSFWNIHTVFLTKCLAHCCIIFKCTFSFTCRSLSQTPPLPTDERFSSLFALDSSSSQLPYPQSLVDIKDSAL